MRRAGPLPLPLHAKTIAEAERDRPGAYGTGTMACTVLRVRHLVRAGPADAIGLVASIFARDAQLRRCVAVHAPAP